MATTKRFNQFPPTSTLLSSDKIPIDQGGIEKYITAESLLEQINDGSPFRRNVLEVSGTSRTLSAGDIFGYIRCLSASITVITIPSSSSVPWSIGDTVKVYNTAGAVEFVGSGVVLNFPATGNTMSIIGEEATLTYLGSNSWDISYTGVTIGSNVVSVTSYAALLALTPADWAVGKTVTVTDDGVAGIFKVVAGSATDDGGIVKTNGTWNAAGKHWRRLVDGDINVKWFGVIADGITDDILALQKCIDYCFTTGETVGLPAGTILISNSIVLKDYMRMRGAGWRKTTIKGALANKSMIVPQYGETPSFVQRTIGWDLADFTMDGVSIATANSLGLNFGNVGYSRVSNVVIQSFNTAIIQNQRPYYNVFTEVTTQAVNYSCVLSSDGGGNEFTDCMLGFEIIGIQLTKGGFSIKGGTIDTNNPAAVSVMDIGLNGDPIACSFNIANTYVEGVNAGTYTARFYNNTVNMTAFGVQRRNVLGPIYYDPSVDRRGIIWIGNTGQYDNEKRFVQAQMSRDSASGVPDVYLRSLGNTLQVRDSTDTSLGNVECLNLFLNGGNSQQVVFTGGNGSPEGVITSYPGGVYIRWNGGAGTTLYVKETGTGNVGWVGK